MLKKRLIAVLICRDGKIVQSVKFKHTNVIHYDPVHAMDAFNKWSVDEIVLLNVSKGISSQQNFLDIVKRISNHCFVPLTIGGWINNEGYAQNLLRYGADKIVINTLFMSNKSLVQRLSQKFGKQCIVASIDFKINQKNLPVVMVNRGSKSTGVNPVSWAKQVESLGAGEIVLIMMAQEEAMI